MDMGSGLNLKLTLRLKLEVVKPTSEVKQVSGALGTEKKSAGELLRMGSSRSREDEPITCISAYQLFV